MRFFLCFTFLFLPLMLPASIIKKPPAKQADLTYREICCTDQDTAYVYEIISTVAENSKLTLLFKQSHLKGLGAQIVELHPLKFLSTIFTNSYLKSCMPYIWDDYFKRNEFLGGLIPSLTREADKGKLNQYIDEFAMELNVPAENLRGFFEARDWENMVLYLIQS